MLGVLVSLKPSVTSSYIQIVLMDKKQVHRETKREKERGQGAFNTTGEYIGRFSHFRSILLHCVSQVFCEGISFQFSFPIPFRLLFVYVLNSRETTKEWNASIFEWDWKWCINYQNTNVFLFIYLSVDNNEMYTVCVSVSLYFNGCCDVMNKNEVESITNIIIIVVVIIEAVVVS